jgi:CheY-like chemotaxis protein
MVSDGTDAIDKALSEIPDIIVCDVNLPGKNGFEICEILKMTSEHLIFRLFFSRLWTIGILSSGAEIRG